MGVIGLDKAKIAPGTKLALKLAPDSKNPTFSWNKTPQSNV
jgi:hypothetical protein